MVARRRNLPARVPREKCGTVYGSSWPPDENGTGRNHRPQCRDNPGEQVADVPDQHEANRNDSQTEHDETAIFFMAWMSSPNDCGTRSLRIARAGYGFHRLSTCQNVAPSERPGSQQTGSNFVSLDGSGTAAPDMATQWTNQFQQSPCVWEKPPLPDAVGQSGRGRNYPSRNYPLA